MKILGIVLIIVGAIGLLFGGFSYSKRRDTVQMGPISTTIEQRQSVPISPILSAIVLVAGIAVLLVDRRKRS